VATLARYIENAKEEYQQMDDGISLPASATSGGGSSTNWTTRNIQALVSKEAAEIDAKANDSSELSASAADAANAFVVANRRKTVVDANRDPKNTSLQSVRSVAQNVTDPEFTASQHEEMAELLGAWEEPQTLEQKEVRAPSKLSVACLTWRSACRPLTNGPCFDAVAEEKSYDWCTFAVSAGAHVHEKEVSFSSRYVDMTD
jgi:hypothetical protein